MPLFGIADKAEKLSEIFLINILNNLILFAQVRHKPLDNLVAIEEPDGDDAHHRIGRDGDEHSQNAADMARHEQHDEDLQRMRLDARRIDEWLVDEVVNQLGGNHDDQDDKDEDPDVDIQACTRAEFQDDAEDNADDVADERSDIRNHVEYACDEADADGVAEVETGDEP